MTEHSELFKQSVFLSFLLEGEAYIGSSRGADCHQRYSYLIAGPQRAFAMNIRQLKIKQPQESSGLLPDMCGCACDQEMKEKNTERTQGLGQTTERLQLAGKVRRKKEG